MRSSTFLSCQAFIGNVHTHIWLQNLRKVQSSWASPNDRRSVKVLQSVNSSPNWLFFWFDLWSDSSKFDRGRWNFAKLRVYRRVPENHGRDNNERFRAGTDHNHCQVRKPFERLKIGALAVMTPGADLCNLRGSSELAQFCKAWFKLGTFMYMLSRSVRLCNCCNALSVEEDS